MYFKKLELVGFKSFCDKTTLNFEPGITAIVGPNGCGKSNIFDAIRWVLGEQSIKSLRGSQMEDVIFNGTDLKEPLGMAEVSLTFDNDKKHFPVDHNEVVITRRVFRSGESEYLLNKTLVRLKDILDLLMGTGIGAENYSLVEQGKIGLILSSKPEDRRLIFDEAAGITRYKVQKKEALRRLEETEQNLLRVNDIIVEVKRQIGSLERQANKARRYKEIFEELKQKEINLAFFQQKELTLEKENITGQLNELGQLEEKLLLVIQEHELKVNNHRSDLKAMEDGILAIKNQVMNLDNLITGNEERIKFNQEKAVELDMNQKYIQAQIEQTKQRLVLDEEKLNNLKAEHENINANIESKKALLQEKESQLESLSASIKTSLENISATKKNILELVTTLTHVKNQITDFTSKQQIYLARKKRLEIEKSKVAEEKSLVKNSLDSLTIELEGLEAAFQGLTLKISGIKGEQEQEAISLNSINTDINNLENEKLTLLSQKEFLEKLRSKYEDISESMNAVVYLDKVPLDKVTGLVIKVKEPPDGNPGDKQFPGPAKFELSGEAKPIDLDTQKITQKIQTIEEKINVLRENKKACELRIEELNRSLDGLQQDFRNQEISLSNKKNSHDTILEQFNKIVEEEEVIALELSDVGSELGILEGKLSGLNVEWSGLDKEHKNSESLILGEENSIDSNNEIKEGVVILIAQTKAELEGLNKRLDSDQATFKILEGTYEQDKASLLNLEAQAKDNDAKKEGLALENENLKSRIEQFRLDIEEQNRKLEETESKYREISQAVAEAIEKVELDKKEIDALKARLYELQMQGKDVDFKVTSIKDRILQAYKVDMDAAPVVADGLDKNILLGEIEKLKDRLDACGSVNLVAIEEYDELKKRYDFLTQQQADLVTAKESVHEAILKINRTTKKMFLETFEKVRQEFRNYFKLLFNGGDAQVFLIDENDPLESGIEIICRPPGKKLQNVLLLSGGEKSLSAIALIFAIFKVKPSPFCVLDEIDAALDEANVDRFSRMFQQFVKDSQFIVITHNKKTIANADVMYGITMQESGVSKIVSVKFAQNPGAVKEKEPEAIAAEAV
ncbi:MAG: AAA family ATPase [Candidatus Omnitrophica bacterium]|nr:AAA family ATPase [Candidatus Omnitrophota bacterium]